MMPLLVTMHGPSEIDVASLSNFEAGVALLSTVGRMFPGMTFGRLAALLDADGGRMAGFWSAVTSAAGAVKDGIGDVLRDTANVVGGHVGDAVRLVTNENVQQGASRLATAYATSGGSEGVKALLGGGSGTDSVVDFISSLGEVFKQKAAGVQQSSLVGASGGWMPVILVGGGVMLALALARK